MSAYQSGSRLTIVRSPGTIDRMQWLLEQAVSDWFDVHGDQFADGHYSTSGNGFLLAAEAAYFQLQDALRAAELERIEREKPVKQSTDSDSKFWVYWLWDDNERLIYVGSTRNLTQRLDRHRRVMGGLWATATHEQFGSAEEMLMAERDAIATEFPAMNQRGV